MIEILTWIVILLMTVTLHEVSHGLVAYALGDPTAKEQGRLTLNPLKHIDPWWTVILPALLLITTGGRFAIGMAKPVPVDFRRLRHPKQDMIWVGLAGPFANFFLAGTLNILFKLNENQIWLYAIYFNLGLALFNLVPIPPLDGSRIVAGLLPRRWMPAYMSIEPYGFFIILALYFSGILFKLIIPGMNFFCQFLDIPLLGIR